MFNGYLKIGDNEIVNNARAIGYQRTAECPILWIRHDVGDCDGLADALLDLPYEFSRIDEAPWYDPDEPDVSSRFLGVYALTIDGLSDSTEQTSSDQRLGAGGFNTGRRHASREVRVRAFLTARGMDALEVGMTWLRNALAARTCGLHGAGCGSADLQFFVDCPPPRAHTEGFGEWETVPGNEFPNPRFISNMGIPTGATRSTEWGVNGGNSIFIPFPEESLWMLQQVTASGVYPLLPATDITDVSGDPADGRYDLAEGTRLEETGSPGIYRLE